MPVDNVLEEIANTSLEGTINYYDVTEHCSKCKQDTCVEHRCRLEDWVDDPSKGWFSHSCRTHCNTCDTYTVWVVKEATPCEDQRDR